MGNKKNLIVISIILIGILIIGINITSSINSKNDSNIINSYTDSSETHCKNGKCNLILYSGIHNVFEDKVWKDVYDTRSLKGSGIECIVNSDGENLVECLDWNTTSIKLRLRQKTVSIVEKEVPIKIYERNESGDLVFKSEIKESFSLLSNQKDKVLLDFEYGDVIHFGEKSTTIQLQDADSENMEDTYSKSIDSSACLGNSVSLYIRVNSYESYIKFNLSSIPNSVEIEDSELALYLTGGNTSGTASLYHLYDFPIFNVSGYEWSEVGDSCITWIKRPTSGEFNSTAEGNSSTGSTGWKFMNTTNMVKTQYNNNKEEISIMIKSSASAYTYYHSKEYSTTSLRPYLNITYSEAGETNISSKLSLSNSHFQLNNGHFKIT